MKGAIETLNSNTYGKRTGRADKSQSISVAPGAIETDFGGGAVSVIIPNSINFSASQTALGSRRSCQMILVARSHRYLSEDNKWVNAQRIEVSGGQSI